MSDQTPSNHNNDQDNTHHHGHSSNTESHHHHHHHHPHHRRRRHHGRRKRAAHKRHEATYLTESGTVLPYSPSSTDIPQGMGGKLEDEVASVASSYASSVDSYDSEGGESQTSRKSERRVQIAPDQHIPTPEVVDPINSLIDWGADPTVVQEKGHADLVGQPNPKPVGSFNPKDVAEVTQKNRRRIVSNIRRKKMVIWMLLFTLVLIWGGYTDVVQRVSYDNEKTFSVGIVRPWIIPWLLFEFICTGIGIVLIVLKMKFIDDNCLRISYRCIMSANNLQYILTLFVAMPFGYYMFLQELTVNMRAKMKDTGIMSNINYQWNATQIERKCCGYHHQDDWHKLEADYKDHDDDIPLDEIWYPMSCCVDFESLVENSTNISPCTPLNGVWTRGCHEIEYYIIMDYLVTVTALMFFAMALTTSIRIWIDRLEKYLTVFQLVSPHYIEPTRTLQVTIR